MSASRLSGALAVSAAVHVGLMGGLLALTHPRLPAARPMRVALVGQAGRPGEPGAPGAASGPAVPAIAPAERASPPGVQASAPPPRPPPARSTPRAAARRNEARTGDGDVSGEADGATAMVTAVQPDVWVLGAGGGAAGAAGGQDGAGPTGAASAAGSGAGGGAGGGSTGSDGTSTSLLAALSQRLAWSAERCAPAAVVRTGHRAIPGVPLHFCLDAAGRPSEVGLLGTTGSEQLDRAARDCVVPGALPLPPAPGCYTVEVRFPIRG